MPSVSVIIAVFNRARTLQSCLDSIFEQTAQSLDRDNRLRRWIDRRLARNPGVEQRAAYLLAIATRSGRASCMEHGAHAARPANGSVSLAPMTDLHKPSTLATLLDAGARSRDQLRLGPGDPGR